MDTILKSVHNISEERIEANAVDFAAQKHSKDFQDCLGPSIRASWEICGNPFPTSQEKPSLATTYQRQYGKWISLGNFSGLSRASLGMAVKIPTRNDLRTGQRSYGRSDG